MMDKKRELELSILDLVEKNRMLTEVNNALMHGTSISGTTLDREFVPVDTHRMVKQQLNGYAEENGTFRRRMDIILDKIRENFGKTVDKDLVTYIQGVSWGNFDSESDTSND